MKVILISGKQGSGKSTTAKELRDSLEMQGSSVELLKFADPLYELHDMILGYLSGNYGLDMPKIDGKLLQVLGTEWGRAKDPNFWVNILNKRLSDLEPFTDYVIIDDARFPNELNLSYDSLKIRLNASESIRKVRAEKWRDSTGHISEVGLDDYQNWDIVFNTETQDTEFIVKEIIWKISKI